MRRTPGMRSGVLLGLFSAATAASCGGKVAPPLEEHLGSAEQPVTGDCSAAFKTFTPSAGQPNPTLGAVIEATVATCVGKQNAEYRFSAKPPGGSSLVLCDWSTSAQCKWTAANMTANGL